MSFSSVVGIIFQSQYGLILAFIFDIETYELIEFQSQYGLILAVYDELMRIKDKIFQSQYGLILAHGRP